MNTAPHRGVSENVTAIDSPTPTAQGPRIHRLTVRNFQSLHDVTLDLQPFTVIVGPSSSGKSALTRAVRTLVSNRRGTEWITHGQRTASITATTDNGTVTLTRSRTQTSAENSYTLTPSDSPEDQRTYAKLGGDTPQDVSRFLGMSADQPINFAGQFDKPFLLDDSAAEVARTLGALTNVNVIFEAARESNRRKLASSATLRIRAQDLAAVRARIPEFKALRAQDDSLTLAEAQIASSRQQEARIARLTQALATVTTTEPEIDRLTPLATISVPSLDRVTAAQQALDDFQVALGRVPASQRAQGASQEAYDVIDAEEDRLLQRHAALSGEITGDLRGFFEVTVDQRYVYSPAPGAPTYVEVGHAVDIFLKFLETKAGS